MKITFHTVFFVLLVCFFACRASAQDSTFVKITFLTSEEWSKNELTLNYLHPSFVREIYVPFQKDTTTDDNVFRAKFHNSEFHNQVGQYTVRKDRKALFQIIVFPNDSMELSVAEDGNVTFLKGKTKRENQLTYNYWFDNFDDSNSFSKYDWQELFDELDSLKNALISNYEKGMKGQKPNEIYDLYYRTSVELAVFHTIQSYKYLRPAYLGNNDYLVIPKEYEDRVPVLEVITKDNYPYINLYLNYIQYFFNRENCEDSTFTYNDYDCQYKFLQTLPKCRFRKLMNLFILNSISINSEVESKNEEQIVKSILAELEVDYPNDIFVSDVKQLIEKSNKLKRGQPAPNFAFRNDEDELVSLSSFKGNYVLIHFWATWSKPDLEAIPELSELEGIFQGKVKFLNLCLGDDKQKWSSLPFQSSSKDVHIFLNDLQMRIIKIMYNISRYPTYFLIDKEGNIITNEIYSPERAKEVIEKVLKNE